MSNISEMCRVRRGMGSALRSPPKFHHALGSATPARRVSTGTTRIIAMTRMVGSIRRPLRHAIEAAYRRISLRPDASDAFTTVENWLFIRVLDPNTLGQAATQRHEQRIRTHPDRNGNPPGDELFRLYYNAASLLRYQGWPAQVRERDASADPQGT